MRGIQLGLGAWLSSRILEAATELEWSAELDILTSDSLELGSGSSLDGVDRRCYICSMLLL